MGTVFIRSDVEAQLEFLFDKCIGLKLPIQNDLAEPVARVSGSRGG